MCLCIYVSGYVPLLPTGMLKQIRTLAQFCSTFVPNVIKSTLAPPAEAVEGKPAKCFALGCLPSR